MRRIAGRLLYLVISEVLLLLGNDDGRLYGLRAAGGGRHNGLTKELLEEVKSAFTGDAHCCVFSTISPQ